VTMTDVTMTDVTMTETGATVEMIVVAAVG
jgi:hypothetical protein